MLGFATASLFTVIDDDDTVRPVNEALTAAITKLTDAEQRERRLIDVWLDRVEDSTQAERDEAEQALEIRKGGSSHLQQSWFLPEAEAGRKAVKRLRADLAVVRTEAKARLEALGRERLRPLVVEFCRHVATAQAALAEIERVRMALGQAGAPTPPCPCPTLLPNGLIDWQLSLACKMVGATRPT